MKVKNVTGTSLTTLRFLGIAISAIIVVQILLGAANPWTGFAEWARVSHLTFASLQWVCMCLLTLLILLPIARRRRSEVFEQERVHQTSMSGAGA